MKSISRSSWKPYSNFALALAALLVFLSSPIFAQTQDSSTSTPTSEVEQLKKRLQQLEQTVVELKGQIGAIEAKKQAPTPAIVEAKYSEAAAPPATETAPEPSAKPQQGESTFEIYGFAMLDAGYQFKQNNPDWFDVIRPTKLPAFKDEFAPDGHTYFSVRQSRLGVKYSTPTKYGQLKTIF